MKSWASLLALILLVFAGCRETGIESFFASPPADCGIEYASTPRKQPPFPSRKALCRSAFGKSLPRRLVPPPSANYSATETYAVELKKWIRARSYIAFNWHGDLNWRLTGEYRGCPTVSDPASPFVGTDYGVHPAVKIYYSPKVMRWLCEGRSGELPDGSMIIKEMHSINRIQVDPQTERMWLADRYYSAPDSWTIMVKRRGASADGWYWAYYSTTWRGNPPLHGPSALVPEPYFQSGQFTPRDGDFFYPTGNSRQSDGRITHAGMAVYPNASYGNYCINCHASAKVESTFADLDNILGKEIRYSYFAKGRPGPGAVDNHGAADTPGAGTGRVFPSPLREPDPDFLRLYSAFRDPGIHAVLSHRLPAETYDHVVSAPGGSHQFITSNQCLACHNASQRFRSRMLLSEKNGTQLNLSQYAEWRTSPMGLAGRDPIFLAQLEGETNQMPEEKDCIENTCFSCHGVMGQRQLALDNAGGRPKCGTLGKRFTTTSKKLFTRDMLDAYPGSEAGDSHAKYGGLARDGISCAACHHIKDERLTPQKIHETFTGRFHVGPPNEFYGPSSENVRTKPMENALGIKPVYSEQMRSSEVCGSCHTVVLPVFSTKGKLLKKSEYEQTTYPEWRNSIYAKGPAAQSCQSCHMPTTYKGRKLRFKIASIQDDSYPEVAHVLSKKELNLATREHSRHTLYGSNVLLNQLFMQFPVLLGIRQISYMNEVPEPALITARESALRIIRRESARLKIDSAVFEKGILTAKISVTNKAGHKLPSGVGFRRAFIEVLVHDRYGSLIWASGRTSRQGVILNGISTVPLRTEFFNLRRKEERCVESWQPHHQLIRRGDQVQIYEELTQDDQDCITSSFLRRHKSIKDNRLLPKGWQWYGYLAQFTKPHGKNISRDCEYSRGPHCMVQRQNKKTLKGASGKDRITYRIDLPAGKRPFSIRATLYYQSTPPYYLKQRFDAARTGPSRRDTDRLFFMASRLNLDAKDHSGESFLHGWKISMAHDRAKID